MRHFKALLCLAMAGIFYCAHGQTVNPSTQIQWPRVAGSGPPMQTCPSSTNTVTTATVGTPYTDRAAGRFYICGDSGWVSWATVSSFSTGTWPSWLTPSISNPTTTPQLNVNAAYTPANRAGDTITGPFQWGYTATSPAVHADLTTDPSSTAFNAIVGSMTVTKPGVFGYGGSYSSCVIAVAGGICYAGSTQAYDAMPANTYTHTVAFQPSVIQSISKSPDSSNADVYGVAIGMTLGPGVWPGSGARIEGPTGVSTTNGQVAVGYDMVDGITPVALQSRPGCRNSTCNSAEVRFQAKSSGINTGIAGLYQDFVGNLRLYSPASIIVSPIGNTQATSSNNYNSSNLSITASGWNGSSASDYSWNLFHNINPSGTATTSQLRIAPPSPFASNGVLVVDSKMQVTGTADLAAGTTIDSKNPCLQDGTNCPSSGGGTDYWWQQLVGCTIGTSTGDNCSGNVQLPGNMPDANFYVQCTTQILVGGVTSVSLGLGYGSYPTTSGSNIPVNVVAALGSGGSSFWTPAVTCHAHHN